MCDTFVSLPDATRDGSVILGKNSDREPNEAHELLAVPATDHESSQVRTTYIEIDQIPHTNAVILSKPYWIWGAEMGVNEHGVSIGNEAVFTKAKRESTPGLLGMDLLRLGLERASTAEEAVDVITVPAGQTRAARPGGPHPQTALRQLLHRGRPKRSVDPRDRRARLGRCTGCIRPVRSPTDSRSVGLQRTSPGLAGVAVTDRSDFLYTRFSDSAARQCRTSDALHADRGNLDVPAAMRLLRDHGPMWNPDWTPAKGRDRSDGLRARRLRADPGGPVDRLDGLARHCR
ncbi:MAG: carcinine hydrolase/isopenicillin-N N-acyltransferase family protein [Candidatus Nanopelagicales bacterium]